MHFFIFNDFEIHLTVCDISLSDLYIIVKKLTIKKNINTHPDRIRKKVFTALLKQDMEIFDNDEFRQCRFSTNPIFIYDFFRILCILKMLKDIKRL